VAKVKKSTAKRATNSLVVSLPQHSSATGVSTIVPIGMSGGFIRLAQDGKLEAAYRQWEKHSALQAQLARLQQDISNCNDRDWLFRFSKTCHRNHKDFRNALAARASALEADQAALTIRLKKIADELRKVLPESVDGDIPAGMILPEFADGSRRRSTRAVRGGICAQVITEMKALKRHGFNRHTPVTFAILKEQFPQFTVLDLVSRPPFDDDDRDRIAHPAQWGVRAVTYATGILKRYFEVTSDETIRAYRKAYAHEKRRPPL
jgi:hypothetical protein